MALPLIPVAINAARSANIGTRLWAAIRTIWAGMSTTEKVLVAATAAQVGTSMIPDEKKADEVMAQTAMTFNDGDVAGTIDRLADILAALPTEKFVEVCNAVRQSTPESSKRDLEAILSMAESRAAATRHTGDEKGAGRTFVTDAMEGYRRINGAKGILARAAAALGTADLSKLRALRDAMFLDEQLFTAVLEDQNS